MHTGESQRLQDKPGAVGASGEQARRSEGRAVPACAIQSCAAGADCNKSRGPRESNVPHPNRDVPIGKYPHEFRDSV